MPTRHPGAAIPRLWLMTDERMGDALWAALARLPRGSGVVFRHYSLAASERRALFARVSRIARARRLLLMRAGPIRLGREEAGVHGGARGKSTRLRSAAAHSRREAITARRAGAEILFVSPIRATRSHPGAPALGPIRAAAIARGLGARAIALGGMNSAAFRRLRSLGFHGWAAIDAWLQD